MIRNLTIVALLVATSPQDDLGPHIEKLRSENMDEREEATNKLIELGPTALEAIRRQTKDGDAEVRARLVGIIAEIERRERIRVFTSKAPRLNFEIRNQPASEAARAIFKPYGIRYEFPDPTIADRKVSFVLHDATLWQALDALCAQSQSFPDSWWHAWRGWIFKHGKEDPRVRWADTGDLRIVAGAGTFAGGNLGEGAFLQVTAFLPPLRIVLDASVIDAAIIPDCGAKPQFDDTPPRKKKNCAERRPGHPTYIETWRAEIAWPELKGVKTVRLEGSLELAFPHDLEIKRVDLKESKEAQEFEVADGKIMISRFKPRPGGCDISIKGRPIDDNTSLLFLLWMEDDKGTWCFDLGSPSTLKGINGGFSIDLGADHPQATRIAIAQLIGRDTIRVPFKIKDLALSPPSKK